MTSRAGPSVLGGAAAPAGSAPGGSAGAGTAADAGAAAAPGTIAAPGRAAGGAAGGLPAGRRRRQAGLAATRLIPPAVALAVMLWRIGVPSYWRDEAATLAAARRPFGALIRMLGNVDAVHGAYYAIIWVVVRLGGTGELITRLPSALAMAAAAAGLAAIGGRLASPRAGLLAGLVFAALPQVSWYGQDARPFAMVTALAVAASYLLVRVLEDGRVPDAGRARRRWLVAYGLTLSCLGLVNIVGLLIIGAHGLTIACAGLRPAGRPQAGRRVTRSLVGGWAIAAAAAVAVASPVIAAAWRQRGAEDWLKPPGLAALDDLRRLVGPPALASVILLIIACAVLHAAAGGRARISADWPASVPALCLPWLLLPPAALLAASLVQPVYTSRYVLFSLPALALLAGVALAALGRVAGAAGLILVILIGLPAQFAVRGQAAHGDHIRRAGASVAMARRPGDVVLYASPAARDLPAAYPDGLAALRDIALARAPIPAGTLTGTYLPAASVARRLAGVRRVWVVEIGADPFRPPLVRGPHFRIVRKWHPSDIWLLLYRHRDKPFRYWAPRPAQPAPGTRPTPM